MFFRFSQKHLVRLFTLTAGLLAFGLIGSRLPHSKRMRPVVVMDLQTPDSLFPVSFEEKAIKLDLFQAGRFREALAKGYQGYEPPSIVAWGIQGKNRDQFPCLAKKTKSDLPDFSNDSELKPDLFMNLRGPSRWSCQDFLKQE